MSLAAKRLAALARGDAGNVTVSGWCTAQVLAMGAGDATVVASSDGGITPQTMICGSGYPVRAVGDLVLAVLYGQRWHVLCRMATSPADFVTADAMNTAISKAVAGIDLPPTISVQTVATAPTGTGWAQASTVYARDDGGGDYSLRLVTGSGGSTPPPPVTAPPEPVVVHADNQAGWRGSQVDGHPKQGDASPWGASGQWVGGAFYGSKIKTACGAGTVSKVEVYVSRVQGGIFGNVTLRMGTHTLGTIGKPTLSNRWDGPALPVGGAGWVTVGDAARAALVSGAALGIGCGDTAVAGYAVLDITDVRITYG